MKNWAGLQWLVAWNLSHLDIRGQCYNGASNMAGARTGCMAVIQKEAPKAVYFHCASHPLNLAIVSACNIQAFKNVESYIGEIASFSVIQIKGSVYWTNAWRKLFLKTKLRS